MVNQILPPTLISNFNVNDRQHLNNSISRLESLNRFTRFAGPVLWKALPSNITSQTSLNLFSKKLKSYMLDQLS